MPAPTVTCVVCKEVVLKARTYYIGNKERACKTHEGVVDRKEQLLEQEKLKRENEKLQKLRKESISKFPSHTSCWVCRREQETEFVPYKGNEKKMDRYPAYTKTHLNIQVQLKLEPALMLCEDCCKAVGIDYPQKRIDLGEFYTLVTLLRLVKSQESRKDS